MDLFIGDKLSLPVVYFNPLRNVNLGQSLNTSYLQQNSCFTAELVGLALRETGSCPAEVTLDAPTLVARKDKVRTLPYYLGAITAWAILIACVALFYYQQLTVANAKVASLSNDAQGLSPMAPKIGNMAKEEDALHQTLDSVVHLGDQRDKWAQILAALNDNIPPGVWITNLTPAYKATVRGDGPPGQEDGSADHGNEVNMLIIDGLYHSNPRTQVVDPGKLRDFVNALADLPLFDIDKNNITATLISFTTSETDPNAFAQKFSMHLKLKVPISLKPGTGKP
jgi:type IV pilus assembly protein PilM